MSQPASEARRPLEHRRCVLFLHLIVAAQLPCGGCSALVAEHPPLLRYRRVRPPLWCRTPPTFRG